MHLRMVSTQTPVEGKNREDVLAAAKAIDYGIVGTVHDSGLVEVLVQGRCPVH